MNLNHHNAPLRGIIYAILAYAVVSLGDALIKSAMTYHALLLVAFYTDVLILTCLLAVAPFFGGYRAMVTTRTPKLHISRAFIMLGVYLLFLYALNHLPITQAYTFYLTQPFILAVMAHFLLKERIGLHRIISIIVGFCGVLIVLRPGAVPIDLASLAALLCAFLFASTNMIVKFMDPRASWMSYVFYAMIVQIPLMGGYLLISGTVIHLPDMGALPYIAGTSVCYMTAIGLFPMAMQRIEAAVFGALEYSILFWGTLFGYILFAEIPDRWTIAGAFVIVASGLYLVYRERKAHQNRKILESRVHGTVD